MIKMTAAEYLKARGWVLMGGTYWADPRHIGAPKHDPGDDGTNVETHAVAVQRARDAVAHRDALVRLVAGAAAGGKDIHDSLTFGEDAIKWLDGLFTVEVIDGVA